MKYGIKMELFEIHITSDSTIHEIAKRFNHKTIQVALLRPDQSLIRVEHMTSMRVHYRSYIECLSWVGHYQNDYRGFTRFKIECPASYSYYLRDALYVESHFPAEDLNSPISRNVGSGKLLSTNRECDPEKFEEFLRGQPAGSEKEICLFDTNIGQDQDWLDYWRKR